MDYILNEFELAYIECMLWSSADDSENPLDSSYDLNDLSSQAMKRIVRDCQKFQEDNMHLIEHDLGQAGHDFWLTRNGHGAGFWDGDWGNAGDRLTEACSAFGHCEAYVGDDDKIYLE